MYELGSMWCMYESLSLYVWTLFYDCIIRYLRMFQGVSSQIGSSWHEFPFRFAHCMRSSGDHRAKKAGLLQVATSHLQIHWGFLSAQELTAIAITHGALLAFLSYSRPTKRLRCGGPALDQPGQQVTVRSVVNAVKYINDGVPSASWLYNDADCVFLKWSYLWHSPMWLGRN